MISQIIGWFCLGVAVYIAVYVSYTMTATKEEPDETMELQFCLLLIAAAICFK